MSADVCCLDLRRDCFVSIHLQLGRRFVNHFDLHYESLYLEVQKNDGLCMFRQANTLKYKIIFIEIYKFTCGCVQDASMQQRGRLRKDSVMAVSQKTN